jgi:pilus assembly protein Flp/PilA
MEKFALAIRKFSRDEEGVTIIEYALMAALIALGVAATVILLKTALTDTFTRVINCIKTPTSC